MNLTRLVEADPVHKLCSQIAVDYEIRWSAESPRRPNVVQAGPLAEMRLLAADIQPNARVAQ